MRSSRTPNDPLAPDAAIADALEQPNNPTRRSRLRLAAEKYLKSNRRGAPALLLVDLKRPADAATRFEQYLKDHRASRSPTARSRPPLGWGWALVDAEKTADADVFSRLLWSSRTARRGDACYLAESAHKNGVRRASNSTDVAPGAKAARSGAGFHRLGRTQAEQRTGRHAKTLDRFNADFLRALPTRARFLRGRPLWSDDPKAAEQPSRHSQRAPGATDPKGFADAIRR